jgi:hypothetical protein
MARTYKPENFQADIAAWAKKAELSAEKAIRGARLEIARRVISNTPVDIGMLKGNWQSTTGAPAGGTLERADPTGAAALADASAASGRDVAGVFYLVNNLPYARRIEYDKWSHTKAPAGMLLISVRAWLDIVEQAARDAKGGP